MLIRSLEDSLAHAYLPEHGLEVVERLSGLGDDLARVHRTAARVH